MEQPDSSEIEDAPIVRPFLHRALAPQAAPPPEPAVASRWLGVRPYFLTKGRTRVSDRSIGFETVLITTERGLERSEHLTFEHRQITELCAGPLSVAELATHLDAPLGVVRVLVSDLTTVGILATHQPIEDPSTDIALLTRLIDGVRAL